MTKRLWVMLLIILMISSCITSAEEQINLLKNPGFEELDQAGVPVGWFCDAYELRVGVSQFSTSETSRSGQRSVLIENFDMNDARYAQEVKVEPNSVYKLSGWVLAEGILDAGHGANISIGGVYVFSESLYETYGEWKYLELYGRTGKDQHSVTVFARVGGYSGESQGAAYFDDLVLERVDVVPADVYAPAWYATQTVVKAETSSTATNGYSEAFWPWLVVLSCIYAAAAFWLMRHLQLSETDEQLSGRRAHVMPAFFIAGMILAAFTRILIALNISGYQVDVNCFTSWGNTMSKVGPSMFYQSTWCDYTPGYIYVLGLNGWVANLLSNLFSAAFVHKIIPMICDLIGSALIYHITCENGFSRRQSSIFAILFAFNPAVILNSAAWCQIDSVLCILLMFVAHFAIQRKWAYVLPLYVLAILVKPQALMLGFLGLAAIIMELVKNPIKGKILHSCHKDMLIGLGISGVLALLIILPFCPNQSSPWWLIEQYTETLASYPYATVNTANLFYLLGANWDGIGNPASTGACIFFFLFAFAWACYTALRQRNRTKLWYLDASIMALYMLAYLVMAVFGCSWTVLGVATMSMVFSIVLPIFIRSGKLVHLPLCGAVIFLLLYVFGIKMHERYLFPAIFLLGMAYALRRDRRILGLLIGTSCVLFINEGIVLDNSIRLGSEMGHLNADTFTLAQFLSVLNVAFALSCTWLCHRICFDDIPVKLSETIGAPMLPVRKYANKPCTPLNFKPDATLRITKRDTLLMLAVTLVYSIITLTTLGSTKAPQNAWKSTSSEEHVYIDLGKQYEDFSMLYFAQVSYSNFAVQVLDDENEIVSVAEMIASEDWSAEYPAQMAEGMCFSWQYLDPSYLSNGKETFVNASDFAAVQKLTGRYVQLNPRQAGLVLNEIIFKDAQGNIIPDVTIVCHENGNTRSPNFTDPANLLDEQNSLDGEPSWWNSTYFDEIYHARTAYELLHNQSVYEWTHPPLGKIIMSWFIAIFGMTPFGWRFGGALCGILMLPAMYLLVKQLTKRTNMAFVGMMLMTLDCMHFTQTRIATIDSYPVLFIILSYFFMLRFMQRDIVLADIKSLLPDLACSGFFMGCGFASKWIGAYAGLGLAVLFFWTCIRHLRMSRLSTRMQTDGTAYTAAERAILDKRENTAFKRIVVLCLWCLLFFVTIPLIIYLLAYADRFANREFANVFAFLKEVYRENFAEYGSMLWYHAQPGLGMDHTFHSPWYEWPTMVTPMYYASAAFKPEGMTYAIFCFGNPWVWLVALVGIAYTLYCWLRGHRYIIGDQQSTFQLFRSDWEIEPAFILGGLLAQFLPWVLVPRGTYIYHYFASVPFLVLGTVWLLHRVTIKNERLGRRISIIYLALCLAWFIILFPYASGVTTPNWWMDLIRDYPYINLLPNYWESDFLVNLNNLLEKIPIFPHVYHH